jgi:thioredoxin-related protein
MILKVFTQSTCPRCPGAKALICRLKADLPADKEKIKVEEHDVSTVDGLAEASFYSAMTTPTILLCNNKGEIVKEWRGEVPSLKAVLKELN